jgi:hypothetical protein
MEQDGSIKTYLALVASRKRDPAGHFHAIVDLQIAISRYLAEPNAAPKPFVGKASARPGRRFRPRAAR